MSRAQLGLTELARVGFSELSTAREHLDELRRLSGLDVQGSAFVLCADPDAALGSLLDLLRRAPETVRPFLDDGPAALRLLRVLGASHGLADFFLRHPDQLTALTEPLATLPSARSMNAELLDAVGAASGIAAVTGDEAWAALRIRYRRILAAITGYDLSQSDPVAGVDHVASALADLASAALGASLAVARAQVGGTGPGTFKEDEVAATRLAVIGMGKAGAGELNYVSDVDVIFVAEAADADDESGLSGGRAVDIATRLAVETMRGVSAPALEPELWEVDANLRPEGKAGALVRTLESHLAYYERWAKTWEFQAMLKARPLAGDLPLGRRFVAALAPHVWTSSSRENFVESVQQMRERVTENIADDEVHYQIKLGPGGLRDIEFTVQLLQLVHGAADDAVRQRDTLSALAALAARGYIGREEAAQFAENYRKLRLLEHRIQLVQLRRSHLMPRHEDELQALARATGLATNASDLVERWEDVKTHVRSLHERLFYRPLLAALAALPHDGVSLTSDQAGDRLRAIGFRDPQGASANISALSGGVSRRATIQRHLLPVMLEWFAEGADPDYGLLTFRRLSESLGNTHWFLRMLRDSSGAAKRLTRVLAGSRFAGELLGRIPESAAWLERKSDLRPRQPQLLAEEMRAVVARHDSADAAATTLRTMRRREVLRLAFASILGFCTVQELGAALAEITQVTLQGVLAAIRKAKGDQSIEFAIIGMGRFGGGELGFGSDADVMYVFRASGAEQDAAHTEAKRIVTELKRLTEDQALPLDLDIGLRPEGKNGVPVRSLDSYRAYYHRWSLTWEAQALLRARPVAGDEALQNDFADLADTIRYPEHLDGQQVREVRRIKARVESERLPQAADPRRHLKLGRGSLSDVEWLVQLEQLQNAATFADLRTTSTLRALDAALDHDLISESDADKLRDAWMIASRVRSAVTLWTNKTADVLPTDRQQLDGVARLLDYPPGSTNQLEEDYLSATRRARAVFERLFYGAEHRHGPPEE